MLFGKFNFFPIKDSCGKKVGVHYKLYFKTKFNQIYDVEKELDWIHFALIVYLFHIFPWDCRGRHRMVWDNQLILAWDNQSILVWNNQSILVWDTCLDIALRKTV